MSSYEKLQETCLRLLTTRVDREDNSILLIDERLANENPSVKKLISCILKVATTGEPQSIAELTECFNLILCPSFESHFNLANKLHSIHQDYLTKIQNFLKQEQQLQLAELSKLQLGLSAVLFYVASNNLQILSQEDFERMQNAILGSKDEQLKILNNFIKIDSNDERFNQYMKTLDSIIQEYNSLKKIVETNFNLACEEEKKENQEITIVQNYYNEAYLNTLYAQLINYPKAEVWLDEIHEALYQFAELKFTAMKKAMGIQGDIGEAINLVPQVQALTTQLESLAHPKAQTFSIQTSEVINNFVNAQTTKIIDDVSDIYAEAQRQSNYNSEDFRQAKELIKLAKLQGNNPASELANQMESSPLYQQANNLNKRIASWLKDKHTADIDADIMPKLNQLLSSVQNRSGSIKISPDIAKLINVNLEIINARNFLVEGDLVKAREVINGITIPNKALPVIETLIKEYELDSIANENKKLRKKRPQPIRMDSDEKKLIKRKNEKLPKNNDVAKENNAFIPRATKPTQPSPRTKISTEPPKRKPPNPPTDISTKEKNQVRQPEAKKEINLALTNQDVVKTESDSSIKAQSQSEPPVIPSYQSNTQILTKLTDTTSKQTEIPKIILPNTQHSINEPEKSRKSRPRDFFKTALGIALIILGALLVKGGILTAIFASGGTALIVTAIVLIVVGATTAGVGTGVILKEKCRKKSNSDADDDVKSSTPLLSAKKNLTEESTSTFHNNPVNLYGRNAGKGKYQPIPDTISNELEIESGSKYSRN